MKIQRRLSFACLSCLLLMMASTGWAAMWAKVSLNYSNPILQSGYPKPYVGDGVLYIYTVSPYKESAATTNTQIPDTFGKCYTIDPKTDLKCEHVNTSNIRDYFTFTCKGENSKWEKTATGVTCLQ